MLRLIGQKALSDFRLAQLLSRLQKILPKVSTVTAHSEYFVQLEKEPTPEQLERIAKVLQAKPAEEVDSQVMTVWVIPRFGTRSPWGSKALDILHHASCNEVVRIERACVYELTLVDRIPLTHSEWSLMLAQIYDRMTESVVSAWQDVAALFTEHAPSKMQTIPVLTEGKTALAQANTTLGLALSEEEITYLVDQYTTIKRDPTDVELMMFAQANSEHCRHKIFKAQFTIDNAVQKDSLFGMIKHTYQHNAAGVLSAYHDNAAVIQGFGQERFYCDTHDNTYRFHDEKVHILMKVETHNHPTAIEPFAGAGTGMGGEIRDEGATGQGARPKAGLCGFTVSHLRLPTLLQPWEGEGHYPQRIVTASEIMIKGPIGGAAFNNEFGRPNLAGYFRTFEQAEPSADKTYYARGYHKPVMIAGGMGNIQEKHINKQPIPDNALIIVLGGPAMKIGLGGGAASSMAQGASDIALDFASVQRQNPEMQRRCQQVIDACVACENNPIISIHDVGAGGLANAIPELVHDAGMGADLALRKIPNDEKGMTPLEIWCNESQERYVLAIRKEHMNEFEAIAKRERCPFAVLGHATTKPYLKLEDSLMDNRPIDIPQSLLFGNAPQLQIKVKSSSCVPATIQTDVIALDEAISRVLQAPTVADKSFLITIGDRSITGLVARDQMVGPWQVPVADCAVTASGYNTYTGEAMSMGERPPIALINPAASAQMAVAEAVLNILAADVKQLSDIRLSCNWMAAAKKPEEAAALYAAVYAVGKELCPQWNITVPVGKDSMSMQSVWQDDKGQYEVTSPVTLVVSAFAPVQDIRKTLTPELATDIETVLLFIDLASNHYRLGGSIYAQVTNQTGGEAPEVEADKVQSFVKVLNQLKTEGKVLAYHDRSDGGLLATLCEMTFASHVGLTIDLSTYVNNEQDILAALLNEELGAVIQIEKSALDECRLLFKSQGLDNALHVIATVREDEQIIIQCKGRSVYQQERKNLQALWSKTSATLQAMRDNPACAKQVYDSVVNDDDPGLFVTMPTKLPPKVAFRGTKPKVAILREQGVNGHNEMAAAFTLAGFDAIDVTMSDLLAGKRLTDFQGLAACGGFSYGDVLGAGKGWANAIRYSSRLFDEFAAFFSRDNTFTLGVCNGCQMLSQLSDLIPGAQDWPRFIHNQSQQFEARLSLVEVCQSPSILLKGLEGMIFPIAVAHGEGYADRAGMNIKVALRFVDNHGKPTQSYPFNPNGSQNGITGFTSNDGRATIMMPHPERVFKTWQLSWHPKTREQDTPWMSLFINARNWLK
ncbi:MAG: phosphoribosylformylglycinamidine synthase [Candidatus Berkiella sp.]